ncbi:MAG: hypothetical protein E7474_00995 [Ruminococcaceae bacterium]|nr:hypothetical protein [Oscillospiraceae bacterium]
MRGVRGTSPEEGRVSGMAEKAKTRGGAFAALVVLVLLLLVGMQLMNMRGKLAEARSEQILLSERVARQEQENRTLEAALERAEDPAYLQQLARDQLGMVTPGQKDFYDVSN